ncbi:HD-GYP domain-containing protein [Gorillibacterium timonense]|uniref:HD-GYP domain-containing protein n=1 Tax=Gorillibacterium timonense TaxID=1689269 RepID=UPI00071CB741|nr:HD-GYP domain-containing protein [Gorillibacterium timonense]
MQNVGVSHLKPGSKLSEHVITRRGTLLFEKGRAITETDKEILEAFLIPSVMIFDSSDQEKEWDQSESEEAAVTFQGKTDFDLAFKEMRSLLRKVFPLPAAGQSIPILDIRNKLISLIEAAEDYHPLFCDPEAVRDEDYLFNNSVYVGLSSYLLAKWHGLSEKEHLQVALAGLLHDIGKTKIDPAILEKKAPLTSHEREEIQRHPTYGYVLLKNVAAINEGVKLAALQHHEREDGSGYPMRVKGDKIHPYAKIVAITDIFHAMTSNRGYKRADSPYLVLDDLHQESFGKLDPALVRTFIEKMTQFSNGTLVKISDGRIGEIIFTDRSNPTRPMVKIGDIIVNLAQERQFYIREVVAGS